MFDTADLMKAITTIQTVTPPFIPSDAEVMSSIIEWRCGGAPALPRGHSIIEVITSASEGMNGGVTVWIVVMAFIRSAVSNIVSPQSNTASSLVTMLVKS